MCLLLLGIASLVVVGCPDDSGPSDPGDASDTGADIIDGGEPDGGGEDETGVDSGMDTTGGGLCSACAEDQQCGEASDLCVDLPDGTSRCARACDPEGEGAECPDGYQCGEISRDGDTIGQCLPDNLTCEDRCEGVSCGTGETCDPLTGECTGRLDLCDTGCTSNALCGDGPEDRCLTVPNTPGPERICATGCNPESDVSECPVDYQCLPTSPDENPEEGVCFPIDGTCVDRCSDADCQEGFNCNQRTGECEQATAGACVPGCSTDAECGGQEDRCLNLGFAEDEETSNCFYSCSSSGSCPEGYECGNLQNTTINICIPSNRSCTACSESDCGPNSACDPESGECVAAQRDCTEAGCPPGQACDPFSTECKPVGRACSGDSWSQDCDTVNTSCTTRVSGTEGTCERRCSGDDDCRDIESCVVTNYRDICLESDLGGPLTCGTLRRDNTDVGTFCSGSGTCTGNTTTCVTATSNRGFCTRECSSAGDCDAGQRCGTTADDPGGQTYCIPAQCECTSDLGLGATAAQAFDTALNDVSLSRCSFAPDRQVVGDLVETNGLPLRDAGVSGTLSSPTAGVRSLRDRTDELAGAGAGADTAIERAAATSGLSVSGTPRNYAPPSGSTSALAEAVATLVTASGGSPNNSTIEQKAGSVPEPVQTLVAPIVLQAADAYEARDQALTNAGWDASDRQSAFENSPFLMLPGTSTQENNAPNLDDAAVLEQYQSFPTEAMAGSAADLAATIQNEVSQAGMPGTGTSGILFVHDTPAGKVVVGGADDTTYDPAQNSDLSGDIAAIIDVGGDDTYRLPAGANQSAQNGVSLVVDLGGSDDYGYTEVSDPNDGPALLPSDGDGRLQPASNLRQGNGAVSASTTARQGAGRIGIGMLADYGTGDDTYSSLRMSQGASVFGVGMLYDAGGADVFESEALSQGGALGGLGVLWSVETGGATAPSDSYKVWHAGQGFGAGRGTGVLYDAAGDDSYEAVPGQSDETGVLYLSRADRGTSNRNIAQGASAGVSASLMAQGLAGGRGFLRDDAGDDDYTAATYAQGYGAHHGVAALSEGGGADTYSGRGFVQGAGQWAGAGVLIESSGGDVYNANTGFALNGQGYGESIGWGALIELAGDDEYDYGNPGGGVGLDGGVGLFVDLAGSDTHNQASQAGWGYAENTVSSSNPLSGVRNYGVFLELGGSSDTYNRPNTGSAGIGDGSQWLQPDPPTQTTKGVGRDQ